MKEAQKQERDGRAAILKELERILETLSEEHLEWLLMAAAVYKNAE